MMLCIFLYSFCTRTITLLITTVPLSPICLHNLQRKSCWFFVYLAFSLAIYIAFYLVSQYSRLDLALHKQTFCFFFQFAIQQTQRYFTIAILCNYILNFSMQHFPLPVRYSTLSFPNFFQLHLTVWFPYIIYSHHFHWTQHIYLPM